MKDIISINPANNKVIGKIPASTLSQIKQKVKYARNATHLWKSLGAEKRIKILMPLLETFKEKKTEISRLITKEIGKPISETVSDFEMDFIYLNDFLKNGQTYLSDEIVYQNGNEIHKIKYEPRGTVACIAPWNYPFGNFVWSVVPNLIVGNTVVFKHSEECPLTAKLLEECLLTLKLPNGVFSSIYGDSHEGSILAKQDVDMIWFTGSSAVGRKLSTIAGKKQIKTVLEMGGSNPAIILEDADIDSIIERLYLSRFLNCGQVCDATKRLLVHHSLFDNIVNVLKLRLEKVKIGDPENPDTELGPLVSMSHRQTLDAQVKDALSKGANLIISGQYLSDFTGAYYLPTLLINIKKNMRVWREEVFGPVLPIVPFRSDEEAIQLANDTPYGLGALVYSKDMDKARYIASQIDVGFVDINDGSHWQPGTPFGGCKASGMGREHGRYGFQELCQIKVLAEG